MIGHVLHGRGVINQSQDCDISYEIDQDLDMVTDNATEIIIPKLTKEKCAIVLVLESSESDSNI